MSLLLEIYHKSIDFKFGLLLVLLDNPKHESILVVVFKIMTTLKEVVLNVKLDLLIYMGMV